MTAVSQCMVGAGGDALVLWAEGSGRRRAGRGGARGYIAKAGLSAGTLAAVLDGNGR